MISVFMIILFLSPIPLQAADIIAKSTNINETYRQNDQIELYATIVNNKTETLIVENFNVTITYAKAVAKHIRVAKRVIKDLGNIELDFHESLSVHIIIPLNDLPPDTYNLTASFLYRYGIGESKRIFVILNAKFQLLPFIEIPPIVIFTAIIMSAIIIIYIGYGLAGRVSRLRRK